MYGTGTRSYNRSTEAREMKRQQKLATEQYLAAKDAGEVKSVTTPLLCHCRTFRWPHELNAHRRLKSEMDWRGFEEREREELYIEEWVKPL